MWAPLISPTLTCPRIGSWDWSSSGGKGGMKGVHIFLQEKVYVKIERKFTLHTFFSFVYWKTQEYDD